MDILVTFDQNYSHSFQIMLKSLVLNNPNESIHIWLLHSGIEKSELERLNEYCNNQEVIFTEIQVSKELFRDAPVSKRYPQEMYYRLLAPFVLPNTLGKILYLDPDILIINPIHKLWNIALEDYVFAAASHCGMTDIMNDVNRIRLGTNHDYYNSGVILIDLNKARKLVNRNDIFTCVRDHSAELLLPDQDVFNYLYGKYTLGLEEVLWNYDARYYHDYLIKSGGKFTLDYVMKNTAILHFCGKRKPWKVSYSGRFAALYKHYEQLTFHR